jgi:hypothetical protein
MILFARPQVTHVGELFQCSEVCLAEEARGVAASGITDFNI